MKKYKDFRKSGRFVLSTGDELHGELVLSGGATSLNLHSREFYSTQTSRDLRLLADRHTYLFAH
jgi:hypothetical protein